MTGQPQREQESNCGVDQQAHIGEQGRAEELKQHDVEDDRANGQEHRDERTEKHRRSHGDDCVLCASLNRYGACECPSYACQEIVRVRQLAARAAALRCDNGTGMPRAASALASHVASNAFGWRHLPRRDAYVCWRFLIRRGGRAVECGGLENR